MEDVGIVSIVLTTRWCFHAYYPMKDVGIVSIVFQLTIDTWFCFELFPKDCILFQLTIDTWFVLEMCWGCTPMHYFELFLKVSIS
jgi:hypothetical protein